jgi:hypothetical protein
MPCDDVLSAIMLGLPLPPDGASHVAECARCRAESALARQVAATFAADEPPPPSSALATRVLAAAEPLLAARRRRVDWPLVLRALGAALLPLPLILVVDVALVGVAYQLLASVLPQALTTYLVANLATTLALLLALTYAAVPLLAARQQAAHSFEDAHV